MQPVKSIDVIGIISLASLIVEEKDLPAVKGKLNGYFNEIANIKTISNDRIKDILDDIGSVKAFSDTVPALRALVTDVNSLNLVIRSLQAYVKEGEVFVGKVSEEANKSVKSATGHYKRNMKGDEKAVWDIINSN
jgi:hypothetical protein